MPKPDRRLDPPQIVSELRLVRASDTTHNLRVRAQVDALLALVAGKGGERR